MTVDEAVEIVRYGKRQVTWHDESAKQYRDAVEILLDHLIKNTDELRKYFIAKNKLKKGKK